MKRADLKFAQPGYYVVDDLADEVIAPPFKSQLDAADAAARHARPCSVVEVLDLFAGVVSEMCMSTGCVREMSECLTPQRTLDLPGIAILVAGQTVRLCKEHARELRDVARIAGVDLVTS